VNLREALRIALRGLRANRLRSVLTMLGIIIGVSSVILLVAIGNGVQSSVNEKIQPLANLITIVPSVGNIPGGAAPKDLIDADVAALQDPGLSRDIAAVIPATTGKALTETDAYRFRASVVGSTDRWLEVNNQDMAAGSFFDEAQVRSTARVVVLGPSVASYLFGTDPAAALSHTVRINHQTFRVIGVMQSVGEPGDSVAVMPLSTVRRYIFGGGDKVNQIIVQATQATAVPAAENEVIRILSERHQPDPPHPHPVHRRRRGDLAVRRCYRSPEHHAGLSHRTNPRDRHPKGDRRHPPRDSRTVPYRVPRAGWFGWICGHSGRGWVIRSRRRCRARLWSHLRHLRARRDHLFCGVLVRDQPRDWTHRRRLPGQPCRPATTHRSPPIPVTRQGRAHRRPTLA
jgi:hypothetical protein